MNFKPYIWVLALALGSAVAAGPVYAFPASGMNGQEQHQEYSKNKHYQQGVRDARNDVAHHKKHSKRRHFKKAEDQQAYEAGYRDGSRH